jgi:hypothetical protein
MSKSSTPAHVSPFTGVCMHPDTITPEILGPSPTPALSDIQQLSLTGDSCSSAALKPSELPSSLISKIPLFPGLKRPSLGLNFS